ncbi:MAG TPA: hypothetical protein VK203_25820 [Nostocaceae cyanobacterium]|nr:hypothetical protein [Nostocaceae cyanobacterium]
MAATNNYDSSKLGTVLERIFKIRRITRQDQLLMMSSLASQELNEHDRLQISKVFDGLKSGLIKVVD